jgi:hypothetical protein
MKKWFRKIKKIVKPDSARFNKRKDQSRTLLFVFLNSENNHPARVVCQHVKLSFFFFFFPLFPKTPWTDDFLFLGRQRAGMPQTAEEGLQGGLSIRNAMTGSP